MPKDGLEPSLGCPNWILNPARLPIPPLRQLLFRLLMDNTYSTVIRVTL